MQMQIKAQLAPSSDQSRASQGLEQGLVRLERSLCADHLMQKAQRAQCHLRGEDGHSEKSQYQISSKDYDYIYTHKMYNFKMILSAPLQSTNPIFNAEFVFNVIPSEHKLIFELINENRIVSAYPQEYYTKPISFRFMID